MAIEKISCFDCSGEMKKIISPHSYDFNKDGWIPLVCYDCGLCSDSDKVVTPHVCSSVLGHRFIERVLEKLCKNKLSQDYIFKKELLKLLKNQDFFYVYDLAKEIALHCQGRGYRISEDYILKIVYSELDYSAFT